MRSVIIDCDPGIDDAVAILFALASRQLDIKAITTVSGNLTADRCSRNARRVLEHVGERSIPVARGIATPLVRPFPRDPFSHGDDGLGELGLPEPSLAEDARFAPDLIVELADRHPGDLSLLATGPLTNLALAVMRDPDLPQKLSEVIMIGGAYGFHEAGATRATGDNPVSEWNVYVDPEAAGIVFGAGFNLTAIGLDVVNHPDVGLSALQCATLDASGRPSARFLLGVMDFVHRRGFGSYTAFIDAAAVAVALDPTLIRTETISVAVETVSPLSRGQTVVDRREHHRWTHLPQIKAAAGLDTQRYIQLLVDTLGGNGTSLAHDPPGSVA